MGIGSIETLRDVRTKLIGLRPETVLRLTGMRIEQLEELESGKRPLSVWEAEALGRLYAIDADALSDDPLHLSPDDVVGALASSDTFQTTGDQVKTRILSAARSARDIVRLRGLLGQPTPSVPIVSEQSVGPPHARGARAAEAARRKLKLGDGVIRSMRDLLSDALPGVSLLHANLSPEGPAGLTFAGPQFGPAIVLNLDGKNENPCVRRFSLAHELGHLLCDWDRREPIATISGYLENDFRFEREQQANAFAIRFLCPESRVVSFTYGDDITKAARELIEKWGLHYQAARLYLLNTRSEKLPHQAPVAFPTGREEWEPEERALGIFDFPLTSVAPERRTVVARFAAEAYSRGLLQRDSFAEYLGVTPDIEVERVLDAFGLDLPDAA